MKAKKIQLRFQKSSELSPARTPRASKTDLFDLVRLRVAQIQECELARDHYLSKLRDDGQSPDRLARLQDWPACALFTRRECAGLALAELLARRNPSESALLPHLLGEMQRQLTREEVVRLVISIEAMEEWAQWGEMLYA